MILIPLYNSSAIDLNRTVSLLPTPGNQRHEIIYFVTNPSTTSASDFASASAFDTATAIPAFSAITPLFHSLATALTPAPVAV